MLTFHFSFALMFPANAGLDEQILTVKAEGQGSQATLPVNVALAKELPAKLTVTSKLPSLRGSPKSNFEYTLNIKNDSGRNLVASFVAEAIEFRNLVHSSIPIDAGQSKDIKLKVRPPSTIDAGHFPVRVTVNAEDASAKLRRRLPAPGGEGVRHGRLSFALRLRAGNGAYEVIPRDRVQRG